MDQEFIKALPALGVGGLLAALMFWFYQKSEAKNALTIKDLCDKHEAQLIQHNGYLRDLISTCNNVIRENTSSNTRLITVIDGLQAGNNQLMVLFRRRGHADEDETRR